MSQELQIIINQMMIFAILIVIGFIAARVKLLTDTALGALAKIVVNITLPAMIISVVPSAATREALINAVPFLACSYALILLMFSGGKATAFIARLKGCTADIHIAESTFGNAGFMGMPLIGALLGGKGMLFVSIFSIADHSLLWTFGTLLTSKEKSANIKAGLKKLLNPTTVSLAVSLIMIALGIHFKGVLGETIKGLGDTNKYLSMIYIGGTLAFIDIRSILKKWSVFLIVLTKMIIVPVIVFSLMSLASGFFTREAIMTLTLVAAMPSMVAIAMLARANDSDYAYASECVFVTTIMSIFTIPFVMFIISKL